jgi:hypothetical protein
MQSSSTTCVSVPAAGPVVPQHVPGWMFYPGVYLPESTPGSNHPPAAPDVLAKTAAAAGETCCQQGCCCVSV